MNTTGAAPDGSLLLSVPDSPGIPEHTGAYTYAPVVINGASLVQNEKAGSRSAPLPKAPVSDSDASKPFGIRRYSLDNKAEKKKTFASAEIKILTLGRDMLDLSAGGALGEGDWASFDFGSL